MALQSLNLQQILSIDTKSHNEVMQIATEYKVEEILIANSMPKLTKKLCYRVNVPAFSSDLVCLRLIVNIPSYSFSSAVGGWHDCLSNTIHYHISKCVLSHLFAKHKPKRICTLTWFASDTTTQCMRVQSGCHCKVSLPEHTCHHCLPHCDASETLRLWKYRRRGGVRQHQFKPLPGTNSSH